MRKRGKVDANQPEIVSGLRRMGASVQSLASIGNGCPDVLVGFRGRNWLMEIKDGNKVPSAQALTDDELKWHNSWLGRVFVVTSLEQAIGIITSEV